MTPHEHKENASARSHLKTIAIAGFFIVAAALFFSEHRAHALGYLPYLLLIACPLLHLMHGRHRHGAGHSDGNGQEGGGR